MVILGKKRQSNILQEKFILNSCPGVACFAEHLQSTGERLLLPSNVF